METWLKGNSYSLTGLLAVESRSYLRFKAHLGAGESAAIAIASNRGLGIVMDDRAAVEAAKSERVQCMSSEEFLEQLDDGKLGIL